MRVPRAEAVVYDLAQGRPVDAGPALEELDRDAAAWSRGEVLGEVDEAERSLVSGRRWRFTKKRGGRRGKP